MNKLIRKIGSRSQAGQESFVLNMLNWKTNGYYVEIGAFDPFIDSNTYMLETDYQWSGFGVEIISECAERFKSRNNPCLNIDATNANYAELFEYHKAPKQIDYLQLDIEPPHNTLKALQLMPLKDYRFSVITFEHDLYENPNNYVFKEEAKAILSNYGYQLVVENVGHGEKTFEDWYVDPSIVPSHVWGSIVCSNIDGNSLFE